MKNTLTIAILGLAVTLAASVAKADLFVGLDRDSDTWPQYAPRLNGGASQWGDGILLKDIENDDTL